MWSSLGFMQRLQFRAQRSFLKSLPIADFALSTEAEGFEPSMDRNWPITVFETAGMAENRLQIGTVTVPGERLRERNSSQTLEGTRHYRIARPAGCEGRGGTRRNVEGGII